MFTIRKAQIDSLAKARSHDILESRLQPFRKRGLRAEVDPRSSDILLTSPAGDSARVTSQPDGASILTKEGRTFLIEHGSRRRLAAITNSGGLRIGFDHDELGRLTTIQRGQHSSFGLNYDERGLVDSLTYPDRTATRFTYGPTGKGTSVTDRNGRESRHEFADTGEVTRVVDARGGETVFDYNGWTLPSAMQLPNGDRHTFEYDSKGRPAEMLVNGSVHATFRYDDDQNAHTIEYADRTSARFILQGERIVEAINETCTVKLEYDDKGRIAREDTDGQGVQYLRNEIGLLIGIVTPDGEKITFDRDGDLNVRQVTDWAGGKYAIHYEANGAVSQIAYPNGARISLTSTAIGLPESLTLSPQQSSASPIMSGNWTYDVCDRVKSFKGDSESREYRYDAEGRLLEVVASDGAHSERYELDANGNRTKDGSVTATINDLNQITDRGGQSFTYDALGNMVSGPCPKGPASYMYNGSGLLVSARTAAGETRYGYDAFGRRIFKRSAGEVTRYAWAGQQLLSEVTTTEGKTTRRDYLFFPERAYPLAMRIDGAVYYIHPGRLGEPLGVTDGKGEVVWRADYAAFGQARISVGKITQPWRLPGQYYDEETGLHYALMRYYNPELGRYLTMDPMRTDGGSLNFYTYCDGDPLNRYDPTGGFIIPAILIAAAIGAVIGAAIGAGVEAYSQYKKHGEIKDGWAIAKAAGVGAVVGAIGASVGWAVEAAAAAAAIGVVAAGALAGGLSAAVEYCAEVALTDTKWNWGDLGKSVGIGVTIGAVTAGVGGMIAARAARKAAREAAKELAEKAARRARGKAKFQEALKKNPEGIWSKNLDAKTKQAVDDFKTGKKLANGHTYGDAAKKLKMDGKSPAELEKELLESGFTKQADFVRDPVTKQPIVHDGKPIPMDVYTHPDGSMVRVKPEGHPGSPRPHPHASKSVRNPPDGDYKNFDQEGFKVDNDGNAVPKWPKDGENPHPARSPEGNEFTDGWADTAHSDLGGK
ncbi:MAG: RHS repeat-associated core domain-containing protein [Deltaproteobacteria bacterium]|nr:RHS repeat-associated core domain-containing protein [Deltaproteobacteria bacterium]